MSAMGRNSLSVSSLRAELRLGPIVAEFAVAVDARENREVAAALRVPPDEADSELVRAAILGGVTFVFESELSASENWVRLGDAGPARLSGRFVEFASIVWGDGG